MPYTKDQVKRIQQIHDAAANLVNLLVQCPEYLSNTLYQQVIVPPIRDTTPTIITDMVASHLADSGYVVFYPNHVEISSVPVSYVSDVYETQQQMEQHFHNLLQ